MTGKKSRVRVIALSAAVTLSLILVLMALMRAVVTTTFEHFERVAAEQSVLRARQALGNELDRLRMQVVDWGPWDEAYDFVRGTDADFTARNLTAETLRNLDIDGIVFFDSAGKVVQSSLVVSDESISAVPAATIKALWSARELFSIESVHGYRTGIVDVGDEHILAASAPITDSTWTSPRAGTLIMFSWADATLDERMSRYVQARVSTAARAADQLPAGAVAAMGTRGTTFIDTRSDDLIVGGASVPSLGGGSPLRVVVTHEASFAESGRRMKTYLSWIVAIFGMSIGAAVVGAADRRLLAESKRQMEESVIAATTELEASESRFKDLVENMADGLIAFEPSGLIVHANKEAVRILAPGSDGLVGKALEDVLAGEVTKDQPNESGWWMEILLSRPDGTITCIEAVSAGSDDNIGHVLIRDVSERKRYEEQLMYLASHDHLTGLSDRRRFEDELRREIDLAHRKGGSGAVLWLDLDNFKDVNDSLGHGIGDLLLVQFSEFLAENNRSYATVARFGGDEFAVLLPHADLAEAEGTGRRLLEGLDSHRFHAGGHNIRMSACAGATVFPHTGDSVHSVLARADLAMYRAKEQGCGTFIAVEKDVDVSLSGLPTGLDWLERIKSALENDLFVVYAQPIVECSTDLVTSFEMLIRLPGADGEHLSMPGDFMPVAERLGLVREIDKWMIRHAVRLLSASGAPLQLDVNISGRAFSDTELLALIEDEVLSSGIDPVRLGFEITETAAIADKEAALSLAMGLRKLGCRLSLDDFGAGFSSLQYLRHLPVDRVKIDGDFIRGIAESMPDRHLVSMMVEVAGALGVSTVAEFVETEKTLQIVRGLGVDYAQGFAVGRPVPVEEILLPKA